MTELLFSTHDLRQFLSTREQSLAAEVASFDEDRALRTSSEDLCNYLVEKYRVHGLEIDESGVHVDYGDVQIDVSGRFDRFVTDRSGPFYVTGTRITFYVPFSGDERLFRCRPSRYSLSPPRGLVRNSELALVYERLPDDAHEIKGEFERDLANLKEHIGYVENDHASFNAALRTRASTEVSARREKLLSDLGVVEALGIPLKRRSGEPSTYTFPDVRRRIAPDLPPVSAEPYQPEPVLAIDEYEHILTVISNMVMVMERSPRAFRDMHEEDLRQHFLVQLNGQYEGQATGETFNFEGKTDILVRADGKNIFIAECKFWSGPSGLNDALDQLLGYTAWRDTKAALLVFNRDTRMSTVLDTLPTVVEDHPNYKATRPFPSETGFRYVFGHRDDPTRDLTLTVLVFDVPA